MKPKLGIIMPQHYLNPNFLGIEHLKIFSSLPLDKIDALIVDVKDIFGILYVDVKQKQENWKINKAYVSYFNEIMNLCNEYNIKKIFGVPCLYDNSITNESYFVKDEHGKIINGRICPNKTGYKQTFAGLLNDIHKKYKNDTFFLPFLRYLPFTKIGITCTCDDCQKRYAKDFGKEFNIEYIKNDIIGFRDWVYWKCEIIKDFISDIKNSVSGEVKFSIEIDIEPTKMLNAGILLNDAHNYKVLAECVDEFIIHYYDISRLPKSNNISTDLAFNISLLNIADLMATGKPVSLFFWNIGNYKDFKNKFLLAQKIKPEYAYFLIFSNQTEYFNRLEKEGLI